MQSPNSQRIVFEADPIQQFKDWYDLARKKEVNDPDAMSLATVSADGMPNVRMVLCKSFDISGVRFFTNLESAKGLELTANSNVALCFHWKSLRRQVRVQGIASKLPEADDDAYFKQRHRESQIGAWASAQSRPLENMIKLIQNVYSQQERFEGLVVTRPPYWGGFEVAPHTIEFWVERPHRLHERMLYTYTENSWQQQRLYP